MTVTPIIGSNTQVVTGGVAVTAIPANPNGGYITNPYSAADQGISTAEVLYLDPTGAAPGSTPGSGNGSVVALQPGQTWTVIALQNTVTKVNAGTTGHKFTAVYW